MVVTGLLDSRAARDSVGAQILYHAELRVGPATWRWDRKGWGLAPEPPGCAASAAPSAVGRTSCTQTLPALMCDPRPRQVEGPRAGEPEAPCYPDPLWLRPKLQFQTEPSSISPHLAVLWAPGELPPLLSSHREAGALPACDVSCWCTRGRGGAGGHRSQRVCTGLLPRAEGADWRGHPSGHRATGSSGGRAHRWSESALK